MSEAAPGQALALLVVGALLLLSLGLKPFFRKLHLSPIVGYLLLGVALRLLDARRPFLSEHVTESLELLQALGVVVLLFEVGLKSDVSGLLGQLRRASPIWAANVVLSGLVGFWVAESLLELGWVQSLFVGCAFTATSVGVSVGAWTEANRIDTATGELLTDVAELDDLSGVVLMALLFSILPTLQRGSDQLSSGGLARAAGDIGVRLLVFVLLWALFAVFVEPRLASFFSRISSEPDRAYLILGTGLLVAAFAGSLRFSVAIGAFFAGLAFSGDTVSEKTRGTFDAIYDLFVPFFFIGIGSKVPPDELGPGLRAGLVLLVAAVASKLVSTFLPALLAVGYRRAALLGLSMVPRAEIALIIMERGAQSGVVSASLYSSMVLVSLGTCVLAPLVLGPLLERWIEEKAP